VTDIRQLTFVQGDDQVWVEVGGEAIWTEESWGSIDQFVRHYTDELGPVVLAYRDAGEDEEPVFADEDTEDLDEQD
jgi:hypothetical protein